MKRSKHPPLRATITLAVGESYKKNKKEVDYSKGMRQSNCGLCEYFEEAKRTCSKVKGDIDPSMWCKLFEKKY